MSQAWLAASVILSIQEGTDSTSKTKQIVCSLSRIRHGEYSTFESLSHYQGYIGEFGLGLSDLGYDFPVSRSSTTAQERTRTLVQLSR